MQKEKLLRSGWLYCASKPEMLPETPQMAALLTAKITDPHKIYSSRS
jgi:hypothetical protein